MIDDQARAAIEVAGTAYRVNIGRSFRFAKKTAFSTFRKTSGLTQHIEITEHDIRQSLILRAEAYASKTKTSFSTIGIEAVGDSKFLSRVKNNLGFNIKTYQRVVEWLDAQEAKEAAQ